LGVGVKGWPRRPDHDAKTQVAALWRAALERALAREGGGGKKARDHRRGRR
jgi:hypothetical protein